MKRIPLLLLVLTLTAHSSVRAQQGQWVEWIFDGQLSVDYIENLNLSAFSNDSENDRRLSGLLVFGRYYQFSGTTRAFVNASAQIDKYQDFDGLDTTAYGANVGIRHKFGVGFQVPYISASVAYLDQDRDVSGWDIQSTSLNLEVGKNLSERWSVALSFEAHEREGNKGPTVRPELSNDPFDQSDRRYALFTDYVVSENWLISASVTRIDGDFYSACNGANVAIALATMEVNAITKDNVFGGCVYSVDGRIDQADLALHYALSAHRAINLSARYLDGEAGELGYHRHELSLSYVYRF